jgi:4-amino-4-deoxy-L-arabinose transferase-like glycosyltransferase
MRFQEFIHDIDAGKTGKFLRVGMISVLLLGLSTLYALMHFRGLATEQAMDQAQIARSLATGEGFTTRYVRPLAIQVFRDRGRPVPQGNFPEIYNAPLFPVLEAAVFYPFKKRLNMTPADVVGAGDRIVCFLGIVVMFLGVLAWYFAGRLLFDNTVALLGAGFVLLTDLFWQFAMSGLPQHLLMLLFGCLAVCAVKGRQSDESGETIRSLCWLGGAGLFLGLMSLTHGVTAFLLPGFLLFCLTGFHAYILASMVPLTVYLLCVAPWMIHMVLASGNPFGLTLYDVLAGADVSDTAVMRSFNAGLTFGGGFASKFRNGLLWQFSHLWEFLGLNIVAVVFATSLLHPFRSSVASLWRWSVVAMWVGLTVGISLFGVKETVSGNQLHIIFLPAFVLYGTAFLLVLWNRLNISFKPMRTLFLSVTALVVATPMLITLLIGQNSRIQWPPYVPPFITVLGTWFGPKELLSSDMPWAVAWYANRKCLLIPETVKALTEISDFTTLGSPISGLYLTPISGRTEFLSLVKGPSKDWGPVIMRTVNVNSFLFKSFTPLPIDGECILYADRDRWTQKK